ncbi:SbcC/MukB-like Walker B domain-containing protein [Modestobacter sp. VKM Ac-2979]|uniref:ATP-binding protein n=1 Tax=unclassified Modestobacter TaxID=2643866 RepID=UPI0022AB7CB4|nr:MULTISPECIES: SbcC/MukB-like Walker B domain-containing protein [unclassified Modestobacter]MCZ2813711.1 SbcC/MukB-like Walker B domain-containing protein [Modestobacter sp. VKM Ac-2979]MCZ2844314.1 SbcC/MukB-like Walker B domain-containing protein [Modestobacter sp. VKM Ac-2980]
MTTFFDQPIPGMAGAGATPDQWHADSVQMVNWGGFEAHHRVLLDVNSTLLTGASGTGKSTILDAYIALMMDSNTAFNGASNDNVMGRARSSEQRNLLSYTRGKINESRDEAGRTHDQVLRGDGQTVWSGVAMTWRHDDGIKVTALRLYYVPASATSPRDVRSHMAIYRGEFDLRAADPFAQINFHHGRMGAQFPGLGFHESYAKFAAALHKILGIGKNGDGSAAMKLLARIQGGRQVASVDGLYKTMVLEKPKTYDAADRAIDHFATLESSHQTMKTAEEQVATLQQIPDHYAALRDAETEADLIDTFRVFEPADADTPLTLWIFRAEADLLTAEIATVRRGLTEATEALSVATGKVHGLEVQIAENQRLQRENGGDALQVAEQELKLLTDTLAAVEQAHTQFLARTEPIGTFPTSREEFLALRADAELFLAAFPDRILALDEQIKALTRTAYPLDGERKALVAERAWLAGRNDLIPQYLHEARVAIASAVGVHPDDLPFVAELIDLHPDHEPWREAAELVLGGFARTMLVDRRVGRGFRARINALRLNTRINFNLAELDRPERDLDPDLLPGRFVFRDDSPFVGWLTTELDRRFDYECVPDGSSFADDDRKRITLSGQIQNGDRGAHGGHGQRFILGFSPTRRLEEVDARLTEVLAELGGLAREEQALGQQKTALDALRNAHQYLTYRTWEEIDLAAAQARVTGKQDQIDRLLATSDTLHELRRQEKTLKDDLGEAQRTQHRTEDEVDRLDKRRGILLDREDAVKDRLEDLDANPLVALTDEQVARLTAEYQRLTNSGTAEELRLLVPKIKDALAVQVRQARRDVETYTTALTNAFETFQHRWPRPNLGTGVDSYDGYREILDDLIAEGLSERKEKFTEKVIEWSGEDLLGLHSAMREAIDEIIDRLYPVNDILRRLPFGPGKDRLYINVRPIRGEDITAFRAELKALASDTTRLDTAEAVENRFKHLQRFIKRLRKPDAQGTGERDYLLDVRRHVHIDAERRDKDTDAQLAIFDSLGGKSGGETQELIAFIVGAALRYQLGNENQSRPVYAPVFLDEGFVKSDAEFAGRAVDAWRGLGFQLIIGAPLDKVTAIEPYMDRIIHVTKSSRGYSHLSYITPETPAPPVNPLG